MKRSQPSILTQSIVALAMFFTLDMSFAENATNESTAVVIPNSMEYDVPPNASATFIGNSRSQQVYEATQFPPGSILIKELHWRPSRTGTNFFVTFTNVVIQLSETIAKTGALSTTFSENIGADVTTTYKGPLTLSTHFNGPQDGPKDMDIVIRLQKPFLYTPTPTNNLLLDISVFDSSETAALAYVEASAKTDGANTRVVALNAGASTADFSDLGLDIVKFIYDK